MIVAMVTEGSHDSHMIEEGRELAENCGAVFMSSEESDWTSKSRDTEIFLWPKIFVDFVVFVLTVNILPTKISPR